MEKRFLSIFMTMLMVLTVSAGPVNSQLAQKHARNFLEKKGLQLKSLPAHVVKKANGDAAFYVYNSADKKGFVIISGDDRTDTVLGYVDQGEFNAEDMPENMRAWLEGYKLEMEAADEAAAPALEDEAPARENVPTLMSTLWDQRDPYNRLTPLYNGIRTYTGCVATAMAQIMKYYNYPERVSKPIPGYQPQGYSAYSSYYWNDLHVEGLPDTTFVYDKMHNYYTGSETGSSKDAVALLMQYAGYAVKMNYSISSSTASVGSPLFALKEFFNYDGKMHLVARTNFSAAQWDELIYAEMAAKRPVLMSGMATDGSGHEFICDGYKDGLYHFNWGWGGYCDGFFKLSALSPNGSGVGGSTDMASGYNIDVKAVIGIQPNTNDGVKAEETPVCTNFSYDGTSLRITIAAYHMEPIRYAFSAGYYDDNGTLVNISSTIAELSDGKIGATTLDNSLISNKLNIPGKTYVLVPVYTILHEGEPTPAPDAEWKSFAPYGVYISYTVDSNGQIAVERFPKADLQVKGVSTSGSMQAKSRMQVVVTLHNGGDEFNDEVALYVAAPGCIPLLTDRENQIVASGSDKEVTFAFTPKREGTYTLYTVQGAEGYILNSQEVEVTGTAISTILAMSLNDVSLVEKNDSLFITMPVMNVGAASFNGTITLELHQVMGRSTNRIQAYETQQSIDRWQTAHIMAEYDNLPAGDYRLYVYYDPLGGQKIMMGQYNFTIEPKQEQEESGVRAAMTDASSAPYYTTGGVQQQEPSAAGLYIHNGKKELIK